MTPFGRVVRAQGRQQMWIAEQVGVSDGTVARWVNGERAIPPARIPQLAELLGVDPSEIAESEEVTA